MGLLREINSDGYPTDYLLARVRGRRGALKAQWRSARARGLPVGLTDEAIWEALLQEFAWLRAQMNRGLRASLDPVLGLFELKTIVLCLRNKAAGLEVEVVRLLAHSQLSDELKQATLGEADVRVAIAVIAAALGPTTGDQASLERAYAEAGLKGFESRLTRQYLEGVVDARLHRAVRRFFTCFVDLRNLMALYKQLRWGIDDPATFITGGAIETARLLQVSVSKESAGLDTLVREAVGRAAPPLAMAESALESVLLGGLTGELDRIGRDSEGVGLVLDYLWRVYVHARNRAILLHAAGLDPAVLDRELIA
jgi:vacuolar-type H+-ATPase subunit C/Vma6